MSKRDTDSNGTLVVTYREDEGEVDRRRLAGILGAATTMMMLLLIVALSLGMVGAAMGVGMGGFVAGFGNVSAPDGGVIYPTVGEQAACDNAPQLEASLDGTATIRGYVEFYKDLPLPNALQGTLSNQDSVRITILSNLTDENVQAESLELRLTALEAEDVVLGSNDTSKPESVITEFGPSNYSTGNANDSYVDPGTGREALNASGKDTTPEFGINAAGGFSLNNGTAATHQVAFQRIELPQVDIAVNFLNSTYNGTTDSGVADRNVTAAERNCQALAEASQPSSFNSPGEAPAPDTSDSFGYPSDDGYQG